MNYVRIVGKKYAFIRHYRGTDKTEDGRDVIVTSFDLSPVTALVCYEPREIDRMSDNISELFDYVVFRDGNDNTVFCKRKDGIIIVPKNSGFKVIGLIETEEGFMKVAEFADGAWRILR